MREYERAYFDLKITRIPVGTLPNLHGDRCTPAATAEELHHMVDNGGSPWISITDNGRGGEGVFLSLHRVSDELCCAEFEIPDESLGLLIESLTAVKRLRECQSK